MTAMRKIEPELITGMGYIGDNPGVLYRMGGAGEQTVVTGNPALLEGVKGSRFTSLTLHGKSTQGSTTGAQLFDAREALASQIEKKLVTFNSDGKIILNGKIDNSNRQFNITLQPGIYTLSADNPTIWHILAPVDSVFNQKLVVDTETTYNCYIASNTYNNHVTAPMINIGDSAKPFEPYTGGKPSPSPSYPQEIESAGQSGEIGVEVLGKNLIPFPYPILGGAGTQIERGGVKYTVQSDGGIRCVGTPTAVEYINLSRIKFSDVGLTATHPTDGKIVLSGEKMAYDSRNHALFINITSDQLGKPINTVIYPQIEFGTVATEYEPYKPAQTLIIPTPGGLPGIPVSSGGNYTDKDGQQWVCDEIDLAKGERVQWVKTVVFDGSEKWEAQSGANYFSCQKQVDAKNDAPLHGLSPNIRVVNHAVIDSTQEQNVIAYIYFWRLRLADIDMQNGATVDDLKAFLSKNPITVYYASDVPIRTPLPPETIAAYKALHTYSPTTTVINDAGAGMSVGYKRK